MKNDNPVIEGCLQTGEERMELPYDSLRPVKFTLQDFAAGYAWLEFGQLRKMVCLEREKKLQINNQRVCGSQDSPNIYKKSRRYFWRLFIYCIFVTKTGKKGQLNCKF